MCCKDQTIHKAKIGDRGILCFFVGYADNHSGSTFWLLNANTHCPILSRDVTFLNKSYGDWTKEDVKKITDKKLVEEEEEFRINTFEVQNNLGDGELPNKENNTGTYMNPIAARKI